MHRLIKAFVFGFAASMAAMPAAAMIIIPGVVPQPNDAVMVSTGATGNPVTAVTNGSGFQVMISGTESLVTPGAGLQLTVAAADGAFSTLTFSLADPNFTFSSLILNLDASQDGTVIFTDALGSSSPFALAANGLNFFTLTGGPFTSLSFTTSVNGSEAPILSAVTQIRLGGITGNNTSAVPEPAAWAMMLLGFAGVGLQVRRQRKQMIAQAA